MIILCDTDTSTLQPLVHEPQYVVPFVYTIFSVLPPLTQVNEHVLFVLRFFRMYAFNTVRVTLATVFHQGGVLISDY